jgi:phenylpropionate dioxygenase-like ring-hydroxylating dioxygenase large terminal subunit
MVDNLATPDPSLGQTATDTQKEARADAAETAGRRDWSTWPKYEAAGLGFRNFWYPVAWSAQIGRKPQAVKLLGEPLMLIRDRGRVRALHDRCLHRGVPLSHPMASQEFPGTWTCCYHGWTYDLESGQLVAVITDGPDSPICGKVRLRTYPVEERKGLVWVYLGDDPVPPVEQDLPAELIDEGTTVVGRITDREGDWRFGAENGFDEGHAKFLHRNSLYAGIRRMPVFTRIHVEELADGWITRKADEVKMTADFPGLGTWPPPHPWWRRRGGGPRVSIRMPGMLKVEYQTWTHFEWWVPTDDRRHRYVQLAVKKVSGLESLRFRLYYALWLRWVFHVMFNDEDKLMVDVMDAPPERLYRPDVALIEWRRLCERDPRAVPQSPVGRRTLHSLLPARLKGDDK